MNQLALDQTTNQKLLTTTTEPTSHINMAERIHTEIARNEVNSKVITPEHYLRALFRNTIANDFKWDETLVGSSTALTFNLKNRSCSKMQGGKNITQCLERKLIRFSTSSRPARTLEDASTLLSKSATSHS